MKKLAITSAFLICLVNSTVAQYKTYFGLEFSVANDIYSIKESGTYLKQVPLIGAQGGFNFRQEIGKYYYIETALILKYYAEGFGFKTIPYYASSSSDNSWIIPLRIGSNLNLYKEKLYVVPVVGYSLGINPSFGYGLGYGIQTADATVINYNYTNNPDVNRYFSLFQAGLGFELEVFKSLLISISTNYYFGINEINQLDIQYTVNNSNTYYGTAISKGDFWCISTEVKYPISNFWSKNNP